MGLKRWRFNIFVSSIYSRTILNPNCRERHTASYANHITDDKICFHNIKGDGTWHGDEGKLIGVLSWNVPCATGVPLGVPDVFKTRLFSLYLDQKWWIKFPAFIPLSNEIVEWLFHIYILSLWKICNINKAF